MYQSSKHDDVIRRHTTYIMTSYHIFDDVILTPPAVSNNVLREMFTEVYQKVTHGNEGWNKLEASTSTLYPWDEKSTYIHYPPYFDKMKKEVRNFRGKFWGNVVEIYRIFLLEEIRTVSIFIRKKIFRFSSVEFFL